MDQKIIKELKGFSGSKVYLMEDTNRLFVRKIGNVQRNHERLDFLAKKEYNVPLIYAYDGECLDMEYIHGLDMKTYLQSHSIDKLKNFILDTLESFAKDMVFKDYTEVYNQKLKWIDGRNDLPFTREELISELPKVLPSTIYHGDLTLENILYSNDKFYMIDGAFIEYDSIIFDIAKMRQDLECKWFLRNDNLKIDVKVQNLQEEILNRFPVAKNDYLLILMLLRVLLHAKENTNNYKFLHKEIHRLWKKLKT
jgi:RIO-like serine/threonine protein kinase